LLKRELGQVWTPDEIAYEMVENCHNLLRNTHKSEISILDPACGPATFQKAILKSSMLVKNMSFYDVDKEMTKITESFCSENDMNFHSNSRDYNK
jgi:hypothetical protein